MCRSLKHCATKAAEKFFWKFCNDLIFKRQLFIEVKPIHCQQSFMPSRGRKMMSLATSYKSCRRAVFWHLSMTWFLRGNHSKGSFLFIVSSHSKMASVSNVCCNSTMVWFVHPTQPFPLMPAWLKKMTFDKAASSTRGMMPPHCQHFLPLLWAGKMVSFATSNKNLQKCSSWHFAILLISKQRGCILFETCCIVPCVAYVTGQFDNNKVKNFVRKKIALHYFCCKTSSFSCYKIIVIRPNVPRFDHVHIYEP